jgi:hypothetical protein
MAMVSRDAYPPGEGWELLGEMCVIACVYRCS